MTIGGSNDEMEPLNAAVFGLSATKDFPGNLETTNIQTYGSAAYKVIRVAGGEHLVMSGSLCRIMILSAFVFNPTLPYSVTFATGETGRRQGTAIDVTLPSNAKYILVQSKTSQGAEYTFTSFTIDGLDVQQFLSEQIHKILTGALIAKKAEQDKNGNDIPATYATKTDILPLQRMSAYPEAVKNLGGWGCTFNGVSSKAQLLSQIVLSAVGNSIEFDLTNGIADNSDANATAFAWGGAYSRISVYYSRVIIRNETSTDYIAYTSGAKLSKLKLVWTNSGIEIYLNDVLNSVSIPLSTIKIDVFGNRSTYWWKGTIKAITINGSAYYLQEMATLTDVVVSRPGGFLTEEQVQQFDDLTRAKIIVRPYSATRFYLDVLDTKTGKYLTHVFVLQNYTKQETYGGGLTKNVLCGNVWYDSDVYDTRTEQVGHYVVQGNSNFIYRIDNTVPGFENENGHVGAYHGGAIMDWTQFIADGRIIDPTALTGPLRCDKFRFIEKVNHYAIDTTQPNFAFNAATLKLDNEGNPILAAVQYFDSTYSVDNLIEFRNKLTIKRDNTRFYQCFGAMLEGYGGFFDKVVINNAEQTYNGWVFPGTDMPVTVSKLGGSTIDLSQSPYQFADTVELFGKGIFVKQTMLQFVNARYNKSNVHTLFYSDNPRLKTYQMPCICTISAATLGETAESFNNGDFLEVFVNRKIEFNPE